MPRTIDFQNKKVQLGVAGGVVLALIVVSLASASGTSFAALSTAGYGGQPTMYKQSFGGTITGPQEVPSTTSTATGNDIFNLTMGEGEIDYSVTLNGANNVTGVVLGCAQPGMNGPTAVNLFSSSVPVATQSFSGMITQSDILAAAQQCSPNVHDIPQLAQAMREGSIYVNVLTSQYPNGEIRGNLGNVPTQTGTTGGNGNNGGGNGDNGGNTGGNGGSTTGATLTPVTETVNSGSSVDFNGRNFGHEETVTIMLNGSVLPQTAHADGGGNFTTGSIMTPTTPGTYTYTFQGQNSGTTLTSTITVQ